MTTPSISRAVGRLYDGILREPFNVGAIADLAINLANSGVSRSIDRTAVDIASTGGPSSLSTLLCPLYLVDRGLTVPKIGVIGRPAGGIDVLRTLRGYRIHLTRDEFDAVLSDASYAHVLAGETWAPEDALLFRYRQSHGTQATPALVVASLLSKKVAAGIHVAGLDARVADHGNFGSDFGAARMSAGLYCEVGAQLGLKPIVFLTDASTPYQPYIGRGEALTAMSLVTAANESAHPWLDRHAQLCRAMADIVLEHAEPFPVAHSPRMAGAGIAAALDANLRAQGSSMADLEERVSIVASQVRRTLVAPDDGFVSYDVGRIRSLMLEWAASWHDDTLAANGKTNHDDVVGVRLLCSPEQELRRGDPVIEVRGSTGDLDGGLGMFTMMKSPVMDGNSIQEVVVP